MNLKYYSPLIVAICFISISLQAQTLRYVLGDILVKTKEGQSVRELVNTFSSFERKQTDLRIIKSVSKPFNIWLLHFDHNRINENEFLQALRASKLVEEAQFNHIIKKRVIPNDVQFINQWQYINSGSDGGIVDADLDAELAWDITTGGLTPLGDTIVACIIDDGLDLTHPDFEDNIWINHNEIPNNNIDDDANGFVDDYLGWNAYENNDDLTDVGLGGIHGTPVTGIVGAKGNNNIGVTGVNWNVKMMCVVGGGIDEAAALAAYTYPYMMRKKYNETGGLEGAFVVTTNASWGADFAFPNEAPLWCSFYDSLGMQGILNIGATANGNVNVETDGDLPSLCTSDHLVAVTNMNRTGNKENLAAYGATSIDLGAFGEGTYTTTLGGGYGAFGGTSGAAPHVTGTVALMYAAPCEYLTALAKSNPSAANNLIKQYILDGVDHSTSLENITVSEGRLNINETLQLLVSNCNTTTCTPAFSLNATDITDIGATLNWQNLSNVDSVEVRYKKINESDWQNSIVVGTSASIADLTFCTDYEFQVQSFCEGTNSGYSASFVFTTSCCDIPSGLTVDAKTDASINLSWENMPLAVDYTLRYKIRNTSSWASINASSNTVALTDLALCKDYEIQIRSNCSTGEMSDFSSTMIVRTKGCGACLDGDYCALYGEDTSGEWIGTVKFNTISNSSGNDPSGYQDFTNLSTDVVIGLAYDMSLKPGLGIAGVTEYFLVWIDFNQNNIFENEEIVFDPGTTTNTTITKNIIIPPTALEGATRMRVAMRFSQKPEASCGSFDFGEVEDYCINIISTTECLAPVNIASSIEGNTLSLNWLGLSSIDSYTIELHPIGSSDWTTYSTDEMSITIPNLSDCTDYEYRIQSVCDGTGGNLSDIISFTTSNCSPCVDLPYCESRSTNANFEWIDSLYLNTLVNGSGKNGGYRFYDNITTTLQQNETYNIRLVPDFEGSPFAEFFRVWIDFNQDGVFDGFELVFDSGGTQTPIDGTITIPNTALDGITRMRVSMQYDNIPNPCEIFSNGEVEDYCIIIGNTGTATCSTPSNLSMSSIETSSATINWTAPPTGIGYELRYRELGISDWTALTVSTTAHTINGLKPCTEYEYEIKAICTSNISDFTATASFKTDCSSSTIIIGSTISSVEIFPNPFEKFINLQLILNQSSQGELQIFNAQGQRLFSKSYPLLNEGENTILVPADNSWSAGIYFLQFSTENTKVLSRVVKL